jgi:hypothetical protein
LTHFQSKGPSPWPFFSISLVTPLMAGIGHSGKSRRIARLGRDGRGFVAFPPQLGGTRAVPGKG